MPKFNDTTIYGDLTVTGSISGNIATTTVSGLMSAADKVKLNGIEPGAQVNPTPYYDYASIIYGDKYSLLINAWEHSLTVTSSEISANSSSANPKGKAQYPNGETEGVIIPQGVTSIGERAFYNWSANNQPLVIPNSVTSISSNAFYGWSANNQPLVIPNSVTSIDINAFYGWSANNQPLTIPDNLTSVGMYTFYGWSANNQPLVIPNSVISIGNSAFYNWSANNQPLIIPNSVTEIAGNAFYGWSSVPYIEIQAITPPTLASSNAFGAQGNPPIYVPDVSVIEYKNTTNWVPLANRIFPISDKVGAEANVQADWHETNLSSDAFIKNKPTIPEPTDVINNLSSTSTTSALSANQGKVLQDNKVDKTSIVDNVTTNDATKVLSAKQGKRLKDGLDTKQDKLVADMNEMAYFDYAGSIYGDKYSLLINAWEHSLTEVDPSEISVDSPYGGTYKGKAQYPNGETEGVIIPQGVTTIGARAFQNWILNNQPLVIPNSVTVIEFDAFRNWTNNNQPLVIPNSVWGINNYAFSNWQANNHPLIIPNSVTDIGQYAFSYWPRVPYVEIQSLTPPSIASSNVFDDQNNAPIYVPYESVDDYKAATNWVNLASRIFPITDKVGVQADWSETNSISEAFIKNKPDVTNWTQVWTGSTNLNSYTDDYYQATVPSNSYIGKRIAIEVQYGTDTLYTSKIIFGVLGNSTVPTPSTSISRGIGWSYFDGTNLRVKTLYTHTSASNTTTINVGYLKTLFGSFSGTTIEWSTSYSETLYMKKIWVIE